jgi:hypothetical protein
MCACIMIKVAPYMITQILNYSNDGAFHLALDPSGTEYLDTVSRLVLRTDYKA